MGKSILKKILAVFLTVAVIVGVIEIPPIVKADGSHPGSITFTGTTAMGVGVTFTFELNDTSLIYNAQAQKPSLSITAVKTDGGDVLFSDSNVTAGSADFILSYDEAVNACGENDYYAVTISAGAAYDFTDKKLYFKIEKAVPISVQNYTLTNRVAIYDGQPHVPSFSSVTVKTGTGVISIPESDYTVTSGTDWDFVSADGNGCVITLKTDNFTSAKSISVQDYYIAYDISDPDVVKARLDGNDENTTGAYSFNVEEGYTAASLKSNYQLYNSSISSYVELGGFRPRYEKDGEEVSSLSGDLVSGSDYTIEFDFADDAVMFGGYYYCGTKISTVHVASKTFNNISISVVGDSTDAAVVLDAAQLVNQTVFPTVTYTSGAQAKPYSITVYDGTTVLNPDSDYTLSYTPNGTISVGKVRVTVKGKGRYSDAGSVSFIYHINSPLKVTLGSASVEYGQGSGETQIPALTVTDTAGTSSSVLTTDQYTVKYGYVDDAGIETDVSLSDEKMRTVGTKYVYAEGKLVYSGQISSKAYFNVTPAKLPYTDSSAEAANDRFTMAANPVKFTYTGENIEQTITLTDKNLGQILEEGKDYRVSYYKKNDNNEYFAVNECIDSGSYQVRAYGLGNYDSGTYAFQNFTIGPVNINEGKQDKNVVDYAGSNTKAPTIYYQNGTRKTIMYNGDTGLCAKGIYVHFITSGETSDSRPTSIGEHTIVLTGDGVNFTNTFSYTYRIQKASISALVTDQNISVEWIGTEDYPTVPDDSQLVFRDSDGKVIARENYVLTVNGENNLPGDNWSLHVKPINDYEKYYEEGDVTYTIKKRNFNHLSIELGTQKMENVSGNYVFTHPQLKLVDKNVSGNDITVPAQAYNAPVYSKNDKAGEEATIVLTAAASSNYTGTIKKTFYCGIDISEKPQGKGTIKLVFKNDAGENVDPNSGIVYNGTSVTPNSIEVSVDLGNRILLLDPSTDYDVTYRNLTSGIPGDTTSAGDIEVTVSARESTVYYGELVGSYKINTIALTRENTRIRWKEGEYKYTYSCEEIEPTELVVEINLNGSWVELSKDDYELGYLNNINATEGTNRKAVVYVKTKEGKSYSFPGIGNSSDQNIASSGAIYETFDIEKADISDISTSGIELSGFDSDGRSFLYDGKTHLPKVTVKHNNNKYTLVNGVDYNVKECGDTKDSTEYALSSNKLDDPNGTYVDIVGINNFKGSKREYYRIEQIDLANNNSKVRAELRDANKRIVYDPTREPSVIDVKKDLDLYYIRCGESTLLERGEDYDFVEDEISALNYKPGSVKVLLHGMKNCKNSTYIYIDIYREINSASFEVRDDENAVNKLKQGDSISSELLKSYYDAGNLSELVDLYAKDKSTTPISKEFYNVKVDACGIGSRVMTIIGNEEKHYTGSISFGFNATGDISGAQISSIGNVDWIGTEVKPKSIQVTLPDGAILSPKDYDVFYEDNIEPGYAKVIVRAKEDSNYSGEVTGSFKIVYPVDRLFFEWTDAVDVSSSNVPSYTYDGDSKEPGFELYYVFKNEKRERVTGGYTVSYGKNVNSGNGTVTVAADTQNAECFLKGSVVKTIKITPKELYQGMLVSTSNYVDEISSDYYDYIPTGIYPVPGLTDILATGADYKLVRDSDYKLSYGTNNSIENGGTVTITGMGNYKGTLTENLRIKAKDISDSTAITVTATDNAFTGDPAEPGSISVTYTDIFGKTHTLNHNPAGVMDYYISAYYTQHGAMAGTAGSVSTGGVVTEATAPSEMGTYIIEIRGLGNYAGVNKTGTYSITTRSLAAVSVSVQGTMEYTGNPLTPEVTISDGAEILKEGVDYTIDYSNKLRYDNSIVPGDHTNAGTVTLIVTGMGNYNGSVTKTMTITPRDISADQETAADYGYKYAVNKSVTYANGTEKSEGRHTMPFVSGGSSVPTVVMHDTTRDVDLLCKNSGAAYPDYRLTFVSQYETLPSAETYPSYAGKIVMTAEGLGNYTGSVSYTYYIGEDISGATATITTGGYSAEYDGLYRDLKDSYIAVDSSKFSITEAQRKITVYKGAILDDNGELLLNNRVDITKIVDADKYYIVVDGVPEKGTYAATPSMSCTYTVTPKSIFNCKIDNFPETVYYTGDYITIRGIRVTDTTLPASRERGAATVKVTLKEGVDYEIDNSKRYKDVGKATITVNGIGNYKGTAKAYFTIEQNSISGGDKDDGSTSGTGLTSDGVTITAEDIRFTYTGDGFMKYTGAAVVPSVVITYGNRNLVAGKEYIVTASNNVNAGIATLTISGIGGFSGYLSKKFTIKADLSGAKIATIPDQVYTGKAVTPSLTVNCGGNTLAKGSDYTDSYDNNVSIGKASVTITAVDNSYYFGSKTVNFNISNSAKGMIVTGYASTYTYTGYAITPALSVTIDGTVLTAGTDYTVSYSNNINVGTAKAVVTGKGQYSGTKTIEYRIVAKSLSNCAADLTGGDSYEYTGTTYTPTVTLTDLVSNKTLVKGTDYNVTYSNNTDPGTATVTMTALSDNYTGTKVVTFNIGSAAVKGLRATDITWKTIKLKWTEQPYATGYQICDKNNKVIGSSKKNSYKVRGLTSYTSYSYKVRSYVKNDDGTISYGGFSNVLSEKTKLKTPKLTVKAIGKGKVQLKWTKSRLATGYEIYYSTEKNGVYTKLKTVSASNNRTVTDSGLAAGEQYYYTVRAYRNVNGAKEYSNYYTIKGVKVK